MTPQMTVPRRDKLKELLADGENVILFAKLDAKLEKFHQDNTFLYFTGLNHPNLIYVCEKHAGKCNDMLFIERSDPERIVWEGEKLGIEEARQISGIQRIHYLDELYNILTGICTLARKLYSNLGNVTLNRPPSYPMFMLEPVRNRYPHIEIEEINNLVAPLRKIKTDWEIEQLQTAIDITGDGILDVMHNAQAGMMEYELEATIFYRMQRSGVMRWGFAPIVAAGINAATLHYEKNNCPVSPDHLVLLDVGASYNNYSADITRCFPISGRFSPRQREIYTIVLDVQRQIIAMIAPGVTMAQLNERTRELLAAGLTEIGLIKDKDELSKYYMHSVGHFLGMDTHDLGGREAILEEGNVITVEPGIYIPEEQLGVRIEDDVLVTAEGHRVLSAKIPKTISELEAIRLQALSQ
ncbi:MAG: aminopeptidase P family protein [Candidatus Cloacimonetes bacterium]|nr:aminopeptidase P family protein [Candidatus Cloacimonadota bacterium]